MSTPVTARAIMHCGWLLRHVPMKQRTTELCTLAMNDNPAAIQFVPKQLRKFEWCYRAVNHDPSLIRYVPTTTIGYSMLQIIASATDKIS
jgi:hypothetical protein